MDIESLKEAAKLVVAMEELDKFLKAIRDKRFVEIKINVSTASFNSSYEFVPDQSIGVMKHAMINAAELRIKEIQEVLEKFKL